MITDALLAPPRLGGWCQHPTGVSGRGSDVVTNPHESWLPFVTSQRAERRTILGSCVTVAGDISLCISNYSNFRSIRRVTCDQHWCFQRHWNSRVSVQLAAATLAASSEATMCLEPPLCWSLKTQSTHADSRTFHGFLSATLSLLDTTYKRFISMQSAPSWQVALLHANGPGLLLPRWPAARLSHFLIHTWMF